VDLIAKAASRYQDTMSDNALGKSEPGCNMHAMTLRSLMVKPLEIIRLGIKDEAASIRLG
jgi:hypothetical protein